MRKADFIEAGREGGRKGSRLLTKQERIEKARTAGIASGQARKAKAKKAGRQ
jgi:hypothetical protein